MIAISRVYYASFIMLFFCSFDISFCFFNALFRFFGVFSYNSFAFFFDRNREFLISSLGHI